MQFLLLVPVLSLISLFPLLSQAAVYQNIQDLPSKSFDFVIVGGGTAGCVLANRLTENPKFSVLVIEAGPTNEGVLDSMVPAFAYKLVLSPFDWNFTTTPQPSLDGRTLIYPRGHILGGSSSTNGMTYTRGSIDDYDRFAAVTGDPGWSWNRIQPYILKNEKWTFPADHHDTAGEFDPIFHSFTGINSVSLPGFNASRQTRYLQTTRDLPQEFPFNLDMNSGHPIGVGWLQSTIGNGARSSAATSYLGPQFINRPNLHVLLETRVTRILQAANSTKPSFQVVETAKTADGPKTRITALKEIIMSAGAICTPQILLNSGIGDKSELLTIGIDSTLHLPSVGKNFTDHPTTHLSWSTTAGVTNSIGANATLLAAALEQWNTTRTGPLVVFLGNQRGFVRLPSSSPMFSTFPDPSAGPNTPHIELELGDSDTGTYTGASLGIVFLTPTSRGSVTLQSSNPFDPPVLNPGYLNTEFDMMGMREAVKSARRFFNGPAWQGFIISPIAPPANATTDELLDEFLRSTVASNGHASGTAAMSAKDAAYGVVDPDLTLKGASGLRIVDASILPFLPTGHIQAPVYIIAERAADLIKDSWR